MNLISQFFDGTTASVSEVEAQVDAFLDQVRQAKPDLQFSLLRHEPISVVVLGEGGRILFASGSFEGGAGANGLDQDALEKVKQAPDRCVVERTFDTASEDTQFIAYGGVEAGQKWQVSAHIKSLLQRKDASAIAVTVKPGQAKATILAACESLGLTPSQGRALAGVVETGSIRAASVSLGIAYVTAREAVAEALKITGARRLPALVDMLVLLSMGVFPRKDRSTDFVTKATGLSTRQLRLASAIAQGKTRVEAATMLGISPAVAKKEFDNIHIALDTHSASDVAKRLIEIRTLSYLTCITQSDIYWTDTRPHPIRFVLREDGTRIAYCDYGPLSGKPVFVFHSSSTTQSVNRSLVSALQKAGYRVLSVDRPGFGQTDMPTLTQKSNLDCFYAAAEDFAFVCKRLKLERVSVVTRGAAQVMLALQEIYPDLVSRVVITNPDPHTDKAGKRVGILGVIKEAFFRRPELIHLLAQLIISRLTPEKAYDSMQKAFRGCPIDQATAADPHHFADYYRSLRPFATGQLDGYIAEQTAIATSQGYAPTFHTPDWFVLLGEQDVLHAPDYVRTYWQAILPHAVFQVVHGAGRLMTFSHPEAVVSALAQHYSNSRHI
jgi:pimeloyl-ACP methyl ester carboxylesterase/DNA-binding CsgD family transcriptional regulator